MSEAGLSLETAMRRGWGCCAVSFVGGVVDADDVDVDAAAAEMREVTAEMLVRRVVVRVKEAGVIIVGEGSVIALVFCAIVFFFFCSVFGIE